MSGRLLLWALCAVFVVSGCGGDSSSGPETNGDPNDPGETDGAFTATIDGMNWEGAPNFVHASALAGSPGAYVINGTANPGATGETLVLSLYNVDGPGTYRLGVTPVVVGAYATLSRTNGDYWHSAYTGNEGTVTLTSLESGRIEGTFQFTMSPGFASGAEGTRLVTGGSFDLPLSGDVVSVPPGHGRAVSATFGDEPFYAATVIETPYANGIAFNALNDDYNLGIILSEVEGPGTYPLDLLSTPFRSAVVVAGTAQDPGTCCWNSIDVTGAVVISDLSDDRIIGTFEMTLSADSNSGATESLVITGGTFDIGRAN